MFMPSFGQHSPQTEAVTAALQRRGMGIPAPALQQQSAMSTTPSIPAQVPGQSPTEGTSMPSGASTAQPPKTEAEILGKALSDRLKSISKVEEARVIPPTS